MTLYVSIIIPSAGRRSEFLQRAIKSALIDDEKIQTEIIVVLNGKDGMIFNEYSSFQHPLVKYYKLEEGNVSKARNYGLSIAEGELIRFLDDDDYLISEIACQQYIELFYSNADLSTYILESIDMKNISHGVLVKKQYNSGLEALLAGEMIGTTHNNVYKYNIIERLKWDENCNNGEDFKWFFEVLLSRKCNWIYSNQVVGVWFQHSDFRLSKPYSINYALKSNVENIIRIHSMYNSDSKWDSYLVQGLWFYAHKGFFLDPIYWTKIIKKAQVLDKKYVPSFIIFHLGVSALFVEWCILPIRWVGRFFRKYILNKRSHVR